MATNQGNRTRAEYHEELRQRDERILRMHRDGQQVYRIAELFGLRTRTVQRIIATGGATKYPKLSIPEAVTGNRFFRPSWGDNLPSFRTVGGKGYR